MKKTLVLLLSVVFCISQSSFSEQPPKKIKIGISSALTGPAATYGQDLRDGILFAAQVLAPNTYEFIIEDDRCDAKEAATIAHKFANLEKVSAVIGYACSSAMLAAAPILERAQIPVMVITASADSIADAGDFIFRTFPMDGGAIPVLRTEVSKLKKIAIVAEETTYAQELAKNLKTSFAAAGLEVLQANFTSGTFDFKTLLLGLKQSGAEAIVLDAQAEEGTALIATAVKNLRWNVPLFGNYLIGSPATLKAAGAALEGTRYADTPGLDQCLNAEGKKTYQSYLDQGGKIRSVDLIFVSAYNGFLALHAAIQSKSDVRQFLYQNDFDGVGGKFHFDSRGEIVGISYVLKKIVNGKPELVIP